MCIVLWKTVKHCITMYTIWFNSVKSSLAQVDVYLVEPSSPIQSICLRHSLHLSAVALDGLSLGPRISMTTSSATSQTSTQFTSMYNLPWQIVAMHDNLYKWCLIVFFINTPLNFNQHALNIELHVITVFWFYLAMIYLT